MAVDAALVLLEGHHVGHHLAGVGEPGQPVDHRHGRVARKLDQRLIDLLIEEAQAVAQEMTAKILGRRVG